MREDFETLLQRHTLRSLKETVETIQDAFLAFAVFPKDQHKFLGLIEKNPNLGDLSPKEIALIERVRKNANDWLRETCCKSRAFHQLP
jgi:hypothetical protein